jgi:hypothetical protein
MGTEWARSDDEQITRASPRQVTRMPHEYTRVFTTYTLVETHIARSYFRSFCRRSVADNAPQAMPQYARRGLSIGIF